MSYNEPPYPPQEPRRPYAGDGPYTGRGYGGPPRKSWPRRHPVLTVLGSIGAFIVFVAVVGAALGGGNSPAPAPGAAGTTTAPAAAPATQAAAPKPAARTVAKFSGSGQENTPQFTVTATWKLEWSYDCSAFGTTGNFIIDEDGGGDLSGVNVNELGNGKSGTTYAYGDGGTHYLSVNSECDWHVRVIDEP